MIFGIGTDIVQIDRMTKGMERFGAKLARRILTTVELEEFEQNPRPAAFLAKRFAAKEATVKAMGSGFREGMSLRHIGVGHDQSGKPVLEYYGKAHELKKQLGIGESFVSIADEEHYAVAYVTLLRTS